MTVLLPRLFPLSAALARRLSGPGPRAPVATVELHPEEVLEQAPVIYDPADLDRVVAVQEETNVVVERQRLAGGSNVHLATRRHLLRDVLVTPGGLFRATEARLRHGGLPWARSLRGPIEERDLGFCAANDLSLRYFGHFANDALPASLMREAGEDLVLPFDPRWTHSGVWLERLGHRPDPQPFAFYRRLWLSDDRGMNQHRRARTRALREQLMAGITLAPHRGIFLRRGRTGVARCLINEAEISELLAARGFGIVDVEEGAETLLRAMAGVRIVVTMEGSQWVHAHFAAGPGALIVTLNPADRFNNIAADMVPALDQRLATLVVEGGGGGYHADPARLLSLLDRAEAAMPARWETRLNPAA